MGVRLKILCHYCSQSLGADGHQCLGHYSYLCSSCKLGIYGQPKLNAHIITVPCSKFWFFFSLFPISYNTDLNSQPKNALKNTNFIHLYLCLSDLAHICVPCAYRKPNRPEEVMSPRSGVTGSCEPPCRCLDLNLGSVQEQ